MRLIDILKARGLSNREARGLLITGKVSLGLFPTADGGREVDEADVTVDLNAPKLRPGQDLIIVRRDAHVAVVIKPSGLLSVPAPTRGEEDNVLGAVHRICGSALPVHRLDEPTSGLMMVALSQRAQAGIKEQLEAHAIDRSYLAIAHRSIRAEAFTVENSLVRDRGDRKRGSGGGPDARAAKTSFVRLATLPGATLVEATLHTGRTHQVRIHLAELGHPVLGDTLYGGRNVAQMAPRLALHAARLGFDHPITGERWQFEIPLADDLEALRRYMLNPPVAEKKVKKSRKQKRNRR